MPMLDIQRVTKIYRSGLLKHKHIVAVDNVSFSIEKGEFIGLLGESGSGKTTLAKLVLRLIPPTSGRILFHGKDVFKLEGQELKWYRLKVQAVFQDPYVSFNPFYKVDRALKITVKKFLPTEDSTEIVHKVLHDVKLNPNEVLGRYPHQLSGGQLQRMLIARALISNPELLVADEPISMIDMSLRVDILNLLRELRDNRNMSILMITHEANMAFYASDKIIVMYKGKFVETGSVTKLLSNPLHPYTLILIEAIPRINEKIERRLVKESRDKESRINIEKLSGCRFFYRCPLAKDVCKEREPPLEEVERDHSVACWLYVTH